MAATYFNEREIEEFRECFYLFARNGQINSVEELTLIMRSLGKNPTAKELNKYFKEKNNKLSFADLLDVLHSHSKVEDVPAEILNAFRAYDPSRRGTIHVADLKHILIGWGERLNPKEFNDLFREANIPTTGQVRYADFVQLLCPPKPDY